VDHLGKGGSGLAHWGCVRLSCGDGCGSVGMCVCSSVGTCVASSDGCNF
jgi:hypothetical protein